ncbi:sulfatase-like hydrolase/transferase [Paenibacillus sp. YYML68]|uniref:sulfatase-like hydrolase/transferase n=1 Tax=Paenibacillus sp. YYML68 TaxID=2909250 RepID=UPI0024939E31|nr:sulfatase-like hydrolase/transferase [Paenibacillus sp. YYML68]
MQLKKRPNILFLMTDQQRADTFSCVNPEIRTPNLDQLIQDSVYFNEAYCANPSCVPSRAAIMTGKFPSECECPTYITMLPEHEKTFMSRLQEAGYYTAVVGKQHFAGSGIERGYDEENIIDGHSAHAPYEYVKSYHDYLAQHGIDPKTVMAGGLISGGSWQVAEEHHLDYFIGELGKAWLTKRAEQQDEQPWFFTLSFPGPHHPYDCEGTRYAEGYELEQLRKPATSYEDLDQKPGHFKEMGSYANIYLNNFSEEAFLRTKRSYYANMTLIDEKIGEVIRILKETGQYDNTLIIYTSDHGDFMGDFGLVEKLQCLTDSLMRVPLFVKPPVAGFKGVRVDDPVTNIDIAATCLRAAEAEVPARLSNYPYNGYWDASEELKVRDHVYMEAGEIKGVVKDGIKTIHYMNREYGELYDLKLDPLERVNLWDEPDYAEHKLEGTRLILNNMYRAIPKWDTLWNYKTPNV